MDLKKLWNNVQQFKNKVANRGQQEIASPLPVGETLTSGLVNYYKMNDFKEQRAAAEAKNPVPTQAPRQIKYPEWWANAPSPEQRSFTTKLRALNPEYAGSDQDLFRLFNVVEDRLQKGLKGMPRGFVPSSDTKPTFEVGSGDIPGLEFMTDRPSTGKPANPINDKFIAENTSPFMPGTKVLGESTTKDEQEILKGNKYIVPEVEDFLTLKAFPITRQYGIPDAVVAGQFAREGRFNGVGAQLNNFFNIGFTDSLANSGNYGAVPRYASPEQGIEAYAKFITGQAPTTMYANGEDGAPWGKIGKKQLQQIAQLYKNDSIGWLKAIGPMYSSQGDQYAPNVMNTPEFRRFYY